MSIRVQVPLYEWDKERDRDYFKEWEDVFNDKYDAQEVIYKSVSYWGWGGWLDIDILLRDGRVLSYEYGFDSCCDRLECACSSEIDEDITTHATFFDNIGQYVDWVETLPDEMGGPTGTVDNERIKNWREYHNEKETSN